MKKIPFKFLYLVVFLCMCSFTVFARESRKKVPKVSVIVPVYNVEEYLSECLESIINQTLKDIEIICINDGSKDNSLEILKEYVAKDSRMIIIDKPNEGVSAARNDGIELAKGEFIAFVDSDDLIDLDTYECAYSIAIETNADITVFGWQNFPKNISKREDCKPKEKIFRDWFKAKRRRESIISCNKLYRRYMIIQNDLRFNRDIKYAEDECFNLCVYPFAKVIVQMPNMFYHYRVRKCGSATFSSTKSKFKNYISVWKYVLKQWKKYKVSKYKYFQLFTYFLTYRGEFAAFFESCF